REVRQRGEVVARARRGDGELAPGELHPVAGVAGEEDGDLGDGAGGLAARVGGERVEGGHGVGGGRAGGQGTLRNGLSHVRPVTPGDSCGGPARARYRRSGTI